MQNDNHLELSELHISASRNYLCAPTAFTDFENKLKYLAYAKYQYGQLEDIDTGEIKITANELKEYLGFNNRIYEKLKMAACTMASNIIVLEHENEFEVFNEISHVKYREGDFSVTINPFIIKNVLDKRFSGEFVDIELSTIFSFKNKRTIALYNYLNSYSDHNATVRIELYELYFIIGVLDISHRELKQYLSIIRSKGHSVDYKKLFELYPESERKYSEWKIFKRDVLKPICDDINEYSQLDVSFTKERNTATICFDIKQKTYKVPKNQYLNILEETAKKDLLNYVGHNGLTTENLNDFLKDAAGNYAIVKRAIAYTDNTPNVRNYVGYIRSYIQQKGYYSSSCASSESETSAKIADEIKAELNNPTLPARVWDRFSQKDEFPEFVSFLEESNISYDNFELLEDLKKCSIFASWLRKQD